MINAKVVKITPELASEWLNHNLVNRDIRRKKVEMFARDITAGKWQTNGEAIIFNQNRELIDGQHRLSAIVMAKKPVEMLVVNGIANDVTLFDRGSNRSTTDVFRLMGYDAKVANNSTVSMVRMHYLFQFSKDNVSDSELLDYISRHENNIVKADQIRKRLGSSNKYGFKMGAPAFLAFFYAYELGFDEKKIDRFTEILIKGMPESKEEYAAVVYRNDLIQKKISFCYRQDRLQGVYQTEKAIDDFMAGYPRKLSYSSINTATYSNNVILLQK